MSRPVPFLKYRAPAGLLAGLLGAALLGLVLDDPLGWALRLAVGGLLGVLFGAVFGPKAQTVGAALVWGEAYGLAWWLLGATTLLPLLLGAEPNWTQAALAAAFPLLIGQIAAYGAVLGLGYHLLLWGLLRVTPPAAGPIAEPAGATTPVGQAILPPRLQAILVGTLGGLLGSWVFVQGIKTAEFYPLVAGLIGSDLAMVGQALHYAIGGFIGVTFGVLFYRDVHGAGPALVWGMAYGLLWWIIGPLTLMPLIGGSWPNWSLATAQAAVPSLVAHVLYGALVGLFYALVNKLWRVLFVDSDPLNRTREGAGVRGLRGVLMGQAGGIVGGLLFTVVMVGIGALPQVASLIGARSLAAGLLVHLLISIIIGSTYGLFFQREAYSYGAGLAWGLLYGLLWWLAGALTLFAVALGRPVDWSLEAVVSLYPSLVGHLLYGAGLGLFFQYLARRYDAELSSRLFAGRRQSRQLVERRASATAAPALWAVTLALGILLPLLLAVG